MKDFHLFRKVFFKPGIFFYLVFYEFDSHCSGDLDGMFSFLASVEPCLCPPDASVSVGIDADPSLNVNGCHIKIEVCQWVNNAFTG